MTSHYNSNKYTFYPLKKQLLKCHELESIAPKEGYHFAYHRVDQILLTDIEIDTMRDSSGYKFLPIYDTKEQLIESLNRLGFEYTTEFQQELF